jgi:hypothetical protein
LTSTCSCSALLAGSTSTVLPSGARTNGCAIFEIGDRGLLSVTSAVCGINENRARSENRDRCGDASVINHSCP